MLGTGIALTKGTAARGDNIGPTVSRAKEAEMTIARMGYTIEYLGNKIVLHGNIQAIRDEAEKILRRFASSANPYRIAEESGQQIILIASH